MQNPKFKMLGAICLALNIAASAHAQQSTTALELQLIAERTAILEAKLKQLELEAKVAKITTEIAIAPATGAPIQPANTKRFSSTPDVFADIGLPSVVQVEGVKGRLEAVIAYSGGSRQRVKEGDRVGGYTIARISVNDVILVDDKKKTTRLSFTATPVTRVDSPSGMGAMGGSGAPLPNFPPGGFPGASR